MTDSEATTGGAATADELTPPAVLTPEMVRDIRQRTERRDRKGWEYATITLAEVYALCDAAEALDRERRQMTEMRRALEWYALGRQDGGLWAKLALSDLDAPGRPGEKGQG